ncbi:MAG TPA: Rrf2 family transcriptional regulator [Bryobacteraceae bacterium]|nr:Rrf2 family transcriptional regulator [Bryobacteraceae bacterium]
MATSSRFVVAVHVLTFLAVNEGSPVRSEELAFSANTNPTVIRALLGRLAAARLTTSQLGAGGGALLARPAESITLLEVYQIMEQGDLFALHRSTPSKVCMVGKNIQAVLTPTLDKARESMESELGKVSIADVVKDISRRGNFKVPPKAKPVRK